MVAKYIDMGLPGFDRDRKEYTAAVGELYSQT